MIKGCSEVLWGLLWRDGEANHPTLFQLKPQHFNLFCAPSFLMKCHLMKEFCGQREKKKVLETADQVYVPSF